MEYKRVDIDYVAGQEAVILVNYNLKKDLIIEGNEKGFHYENIIFKSFKVKLMRHDDDLVWLVKLVDGEYDYTSCEKHFFRKDEIYSKGVFTEKDNIVCLVYVESSKYVYLNHSSYEYLDEAEYDEFKYFAKYYKYNRNKKITDKQEVKKQSKKLWDYIYDVVSTD